MSVRTCGLFVVVSALWGFPYIFIKVALDEGVPPLSLVALRTAIAALVLLPFAASRRWIRTLVHRAHQLVLLAFVEVVIPFVLITWGEHTVSSSLTGVLVATEPIVVACLTVALASNDRLGCLGWAGLTAGFAGVTLLLGVSSVGSGAMLVLLAAGCYGLGAVLIGHWFDDVPASVVACVMLILASVPMAAWSLTTEPLAQPTAKAWWAILALGLACTAGGFVGYFELIKRAGSTRAALTAYVAPVAATFAGAAFLQETISPRSGLGTGLILIGAALTAFRGATSRRSRPPDSSR